MHSCFIFCPCFYNAFFSLYWYTIQTPLALAEVYLPANFPASYAMDVLGCRISLNRSRDGTGIMVDYAQGCCRDPFGS